MNETNELYYCRVCGLYLDYPIWGEDGDEPSFFICPCCGVEFGYEDSLLEGVRSFRKEWLNHGANWFEKKLKPIDWNLKNQLSKIPKNWR